MKTKFLVKLLCIFTALTCFFACSFSKKDLGDIITVYDSNNKKIAEFTDQKDIEYYSDLVGNTTENISEDNANLLYRKIPSDAKVRYKYVFTHRKDNGKKTSVNFFVYENYPYITLKGIPFIPDVTWELSEKDYNLLQNPVK